MLFSSPASFTPLFLKILKPSTFVYFRVSSLRSGCWCLCEPVISILTSIPSSESAKGVQEVGHKHSWRTIGPFYKVQVCLPCKHTGAGPLAEVYLLAQIVHGEVEGSPNEKTPPAALIIALIPLWPQKGKSQAPSESKRLSGKTRHWPEQAAE